MIKISSFADRLKAYRIENDMTLKDLEMVTGVPAQTLNRYELGQRIPKVDKAGEIAELLGVSSLWLQGYNVPMKNTVDADEEANDLFKDKEVRAVARAYNKVSPKNRMLLKQLVESMAEEAEKDAKKDK